MLGAASVQAAQRDDLVGPAFQVKGRKSFLQAGAFLLRRRHARKFKSAGLGVIREEVSDEFRAGRRQRYRLSLPARLRMGPELGERQSILRDRIRYSHKRQIAVGGDADELIRHERRVVAIRDETDLLAVRLVGNVQPQPARLVADLRLHQAADREHRARELLLCQ